MYIYMYVYVYVYIYACVCVCVCVRARVRACVYVCVYVCVYIYMYIYMCVCMYACMHACMHTYTHKKETGLHFTRSEKLSVPIIPRGGAFWMISKAHELIQSHPILSFLFNLIESNLVQPNPK